MQHAIKYYREKLGISQAKLAEKIGVGQSTVGMWESGLNTPSTKYLPLIAKALKCTVDDLFKFKQK